MTKSELAERLDANGYRLRVERSPRQHVTCYRAVRKGFDVGREIPTTGDSILIGSRRFGEPRNFHSMALTFREATRA